MSKKFLITGVAGSGKSTVARQLAKRGYAAYDTEAGFSYYVNKNSGEQVSPPVHPSHEWYQKHERVLDDNVLNNLFKKHQDEPLFIASITANQKKYYPEFDKLFLLTTNEQLITKRLAERPNNHFGKHPLDLERVVSRHAAFDNELKDLGAIVIDTARPLSQVVEQILDNIK